MFFNRYNHKELDNYNYTQEFQEEKFSFVYAVGYTEGSALVTKLENSGEIVWQNKYFEENTNNIAATKIIQIKIKDFYILVLQQGLNIIGLKPENGEVLWNFSLLEYSENDIHISEIENQPFFVLSYLNKENRQYISLIDSNGSIIKTIIPIFKFPLLIKTIKTTNKEIFVGGNLIPDKGNELSIIPIVVIFDTELNEIKNYLLESMSGYIQSIDIISLENFIVSGYEHKDKKIFFSNHPNDNKSLSTFFYIDDTNVSSKIILNGLNLYLLTHQLEGVLYKLDTSNYCLWSKTIATSDSMPTLFNHVNLENNCFNFYTYERSNGSLVGRCNLEFETCKTKILDNNEILEIKVNVNEINFELKHLEIKFQNTTINYIPHNCDFTPICLKYEDGGTPTINENTKLQSPNLLLTVAGSLGGDGSAIGNHLRWSFAGKLAELHLPKGNFTNETFLFNKPNDYVKIFKTKYLPKTQTLDFSNPPISVDNNNGLWVYNLQGKILYIYFRNIIKYNNVLLNFNPLNNTLDFLTSYGNELIEVTCKNELFFGIKLIGDQITISTEVKLELLSVKENLPLSPKILHTRKTCDETNFQDKLFCQNGRSCRYIITEGVIFSIEFEFYSDFVTQTPKKEWVFLGKHALSINDEEVLNRLEPIPNLVHGKWLRYNDGQTVNINNYIHKWNVVENGEDKNIKKAVSTFLNVSTNPNELNPKGIVSSDDEELNEDNSLELLELLNSGTIDYHIARMLGLGCLDINEDVVDGSTYIYASEYITLKDINNPEFDQTITHLSLSLPTSIYDERLPLAYEIDYITPGILSIENGLYLDNLTDEDGYTFEGDLRFVTIKNVPLIDQSENPGFFISNKELDWSTFSLPIFAGVERKMNSESYWQKPEIRNDEFYKNIINNEIGCNESISIFPDENFNIILTDKHDASGTYYYGTYGVNIFSRATNGSLIETIQTNLVPKNRLTPPTNVLAQLIQKEDQLFFTTEQEQQRFNNNPNSDKTLVRLVFDYNHRQELNSYQILDEHLELSHSQLESSLISGEPNPLYPDDKELFADHVEISFRNEIPQQVSGKIISLTDHPTNPALLIINTEVFTYSSQPFPNPADNILTPVINANDINNFIGGVLLNGNKQYFIQQINLNSTYPEFHVLDKTMDNNPDYQTPTIESDGLFQLIENMQNQSSWDNSINQQNGLNPHSFFVNLNHLGPIKREVITLEGDEGQIVKHLEKARGFWSNAIITEEQEVINISSDGNETPIYGFKGLYKLSFNETVLPNPPQFSLNQDSAEWFKGLVRLRTTSQHILGGKRENYDVIKMEFDQSNHLILFIRDTQYPIDLVEQSTYDFIQLGNQSINYYPSFKVYLYKNTILNLTENNTLPANPEDTKLTIFGLRAVNNQYNYKSKYSVPASMFGQLQQTPQQPQQPLGAKYATRPDFYGKSTYSFETSFGNNNSAYNPHGLMFLRTNEELIFNALYSPETILQIKQFLKPLGGNNEIWLQDRWDNFMNFNLLRNETNYKAFPPNEDNNFALPLPNNLKLIEEINAFITWHNSKSTIQVPLLIEITALNQIVISTEVASPLLIIDFIEEAIKNTYFPLTEIPVIFKYIKVDNKPNPKKQKIKDDNGFMLSPDDPEFDMAPMAKRMNSSSNNVYFTDFTLDGTSQNIYFYAVKEMNLQMQIGKMSQPIGPIKLINSNPPEAPEIVSVIPVLMNPVLGISAAIQIEINAYNNVHQVNKIEVYRTFDRVKALSIQTMTLLQTIFVDVAYNENQTTWKIIDNFSDLPEIPYGDPIYYRIVSCRKVQYYENGSLINEYAPSLPSKLLATMVVENITPESPTVNYTADTYNQLTDTALNYITLSWEQTVYKGNYYLYKMNNHGNWVQIIKIVADRNTKGVFSIYNLDAQGNWVNSIHPNLIMVFNDIIYLPLELTNLAITSLVTKTADGNPVYHHFKVIAENTAGMFSSKENILTMFNANSYHSNGGIAPDLGDDGMIIQGDFIVKQN